MRTDRERGAVNLYLDRSWRAAPSSPPLERLSYWRCRAGAGRRYASHPFCVWFATTAGAVDNAREWPRFSSPRADSGEKAVGVLVTSEELG